MGTPWRSDNFVKINLTKSRALKRKSHRWALYFARLVHQNWLARILHFFVVVHECNLTFGFLLAQCLRESVSSPVARIDHFRFVSLAHEIAIFGIDQVILLVVVLDARSEGAPVDASKNVH